MTISLPTGITIRDFRLSFVWVATILDDRSDGREFVQRAGYEKLFNTLQTTGAQNGFSLPWPREHPFAHRFWLRYLATTNPAQTSSSTGWMKGVPFRASGRPIALALPSFKGRVFAEPYFYPFGLALVVTLTGKDPVEAGAWVDQAAKAATAPFSVAFDQEPATTLNLSALASEWFERMRIKYFDAKATLSVAPDHFTIMTVCRGTGVDEKVQPTDDIHQLLFGAASLVKNWATSARQPALAVPMLKIKSGGSPGDVVFATKRGRAIWIPSSFGKETSLTSQSCYHRNQLMGALQVESLCNLARALRTRIDANLNLPNHINMLGPIAAKVLVDIHKGETNTYRSISLQRQIDDRGSRQDIVRLRQRYALPPWN